MGASFSRAVVSMGAHTSHNISGKTSQTHLRMLLGMMESTRSRVRRAFVRVARGQYLETLPLLPASNPPCEGALGAL